MLSPTQWWSTWRRSTKMRFLFWSNATCGPVCLACEDWCSRGSRSERSQSLCIEESRGASRLSQVAINRGRGIVRVIQNKTFAYRFLTATSSSSNLSVYDDHRLLRPMDSSTLPIHPRTSCTTSSPSARWIDLSSSSSFPISSSLHRPIDRHQTTP